MSDIYCHINATLQNIYDGNTVVTIDAVVYVVLFLANKTIIKCLLLLSLSRNAPFK